MTKAEIIEELKKLEATHIECEVSCPTEVIELEDAAEWFEKKVKEAGNWEETARQYARNMEYYRGLVDNIALVFGQRAYICDDGSKAEDVLRAKIPELVREMAGKFCERTEGDLAERLFIAIVGSTEPILNSMQLQNAVKSSYKLAEAFLKEGRK